MRKYQIGLLVPVLMMFSYSITAQAIPNFKYSNAGLTVSKKGVMLKGGRPYAGIGVNYFDAFYRVLKDSKDKSYQKGFKQLSDLGIPFVRFMASGYWPKDMLLYQKNPTRYFQLLDEVVVSAEKHNVGLIFSLFWNHVTISDLVGEPVRQWGNPNSKTNAFMRKYTAEVVSRYYNSPVVWGWEFGNEMNLQVDLPNAAEHRPPVVKAKGTPSRRTAQDELSGNDMKIALTEFAKQVRTIDTYRFISSGNSMPRASAYHNSRYRSWDLDTARQTEAVINRDNPDPINTLSVHLYQDNSFFKRNKTNFSSFIKKINKISSKQKKPVFISEFGMCSKQLMSTFNEMLSVIRKNNIPLAALWVYDLESQNESCNVTISNHRAYQLKAISR